MGGISFIAMAALFINDSLDGQLGFLGGLYLAVVAYLYVISDMLPKLSHMTILDYYAYFNMFFLAVLIVECIVLNILKN